MKVYYITDKDFINSEIFSEYMKNNPEKGNLKVRAYSASLAVPVKGVKVIVSSYFDENNKIIFYEGETDESGLTPKISLPAPRLSNDNMIVPLKKEYEIEAIYPKDNIKLLYKVDIYEDVCVMQDINIVPELKVGGFNGR